jgi:DNA-binding CsgD family transcriptional regulator
MGDAIAWLDAHIASGDTDETLVANNENEAPRQRLTETEAQILRLVSTGKQPAEVAAAIGADETAVKEHIKAILRKAISSGRPVGRRKAMDLCSSGQLASNMLSPFTA